MLLMSCAHTADGLSCERIESQDHEVAARRGQLGSEIGLRARPSTDPHGRHGARRQQLKAQSSGPQSTGYGSCCRLRS